MKKYVLSLTSIILGVACFLGIISNNVFADDINNLTGSSTFETYYPYGIEDYADLNNLIAFTISDSHFYYAVETDSDYQLNRYNLYTKLHEELKTYNKISANQIKSLKFLNNQLFVLNGTTLHVFNEDDFNNNIVNLPINGEFGAINHPYDVNYKNNEYVFAIIKNKTQSLQSLNLFYYNNLQTTHTKALDLDLTYNIVNMAMNDNYLYIVGSDNLIHIYDVFDVDTLEEYSNSDTNTPTTIINNMHDIDSFTINEENYFALTSTYGLNIYNTNYLLKGSFTSTQVNISSPQLLTISSKNNILSAFVYDYNNSNIQKLSLNYVDENTGFNIDTPTIMLAGKGKSLGRFDNANSITLKNDKVLFVSDKNNNRIQILSDNNIKSIDLGSDYASNLILDEDHNLLFLKHTQSGVYLSGYKYDNGNFETKLFDDKSLSSTTNSMCLSLSGKLYFLDYSNNTISVLEQYNKNFSSFNLTTISPNSNSKIQYSNTFSELIISVDNTLYRIATDSGIVNSEKITFDNNINYYEIDFSNNVYVLSNNKLYKTKFGNETNECVIDLQINCDLFSLNQANGKIYAYNKGKSCIQTITNENFSNGLLEFPHETDKIFNKTAYSSVLKYATLKNNVFVYNDVNYVGDFFYSEQGIGTNVIILQENINNNPLFIRVGYIAENKLNIGYVKQDDINIINDCYIEKTYNLRTTNKSVSIFKYPTLASNVVVDTISLGSPITAIGTYSGIFDNSNNFFYIVEVDDKIGYVYSGDVTANVNISTKYETNAEIRILDHSEGVYLYSEPDENSPKILINENQRIYVKDFDKTHTFTLVSYVDDEHIEHVGYVYTKYIKMDGINTTLLTAIILFSLTIILGITLLIFYLSYKKKLSHHGEENVKTTNINDASFSQRKNKPELIDESKSNEEDNEE